MACLTVRDLSLGYGDRIILEGLNFSVSEGDYLCIVGENGSGKTTLMRTLLQLREPYRGWILTGDGLQQSEIGYLPQQKPPSNMQAIFCISARKSFSDGRRNTGIPRTTRMSKMKSALPAYLISTRKRATLTSRSEMRSF